MQKKCIICSKCFFSKSNNAKTCSDKCRSAHRRHRVRKTKEKNKKEFICKFCKKKRRQTLLKKYGINNAFALAKHKCTSRPQKEIFDHLISSGIKASLNHSFIYENSRGKFYLADLFI